MEIRLLASAAKVLTKVAGRSLQFAFLRKSNLEASLKGTNLVSRGNLCLKELVETIFDVCQCVGELNSPSWGYLVTCRCFHFKHDTKQSPKHRIQERAAPLSLRTPSWFPDFKVKMLSVQKHFYDWHCGSVARDPVRDTSVLVRLVVADSGQLKGL